MSSLTTPMNLWSLVPVDDIYRHMLAICKESSRIASQVIKSKTTIARNSDNYAASRSRELNKLIGYGVTKSVDNRMNITSTTYATTGIDLHDSRCTIVSPIRSYLTSSTQNTMSGGSTSKHTPYILPTYTNEDIKQWRMLMAKLPSIPKRAPTLSKYSLDVSLISTDDETKQWKMLLANIY